MAIHNFNLAEKNVPDGVHGTSASLVVNDNPSNIIVQLVSSEWAAKSGLGTLRWGTEYSPDGVNYTEWFYQTVTIGDVGKNGLPPAISVSGGQLATLVGYSVRLFAEPVGINILLGATGSITN